MSVLLSSRNIVPKLEYGSCIVFLLYHDKSFFFILYVLLKVENKYIKNYIILNLIIYINAVKWGMQDNTQTLPKMLGSFLTLPLPIYLHPKHCLIRDEVGIEKSYSIIIFNC